MKKPVRFRGGYPLLRRVLKSDPAGAWSMRKAMMVTGLIAANDNMPAPGAAAGFSSERRQQFKPTVDQMVSDAHRVRVTCSVKDPVGTMVRHAGAHDLKVIAADTFRLGDMFFSTSSARRRPAAGGLMLSFGWSAKGQPIQPQIETRDEKGGVAGTERSEAAKRTYLKRPATTPSPLSATGERRPFSGEPALPKMYDPLPGVEAARAFLVELGIDGSVPLARIGMGTALPDGFAKNMMCFGGICASKETAKTPIPVAELGQDEPGNISELALAVLAVTAERGTLADLGVRLGFRGGYADRAGRGALANAVSELKSIFPAPANQNVAARVPFRAASSGTQ